MPTIYPPPNTKYPTIYKAAYLMLVYDNGCPIERVLEGYHLALKKYSASTLQHVEAELAGMTPNELEDVCCGEHDEAKQSPDADKVLNTIFGEDE